MATLSVSEVYPLPRVRVTIERDGKQVWPQTTLYDYWWARG